jgi:molybdopterin converting factor subunit 1
MPRPYYQGNQAVQIQVKLFATLRDRAKTSLLTVEMAEGATVADLRQRIAADHPALASALNACLVAVNHEFAFDATRLREGCEVALFPPVSGGGARPTITRIASEAFDANQIAQDLTRPTTGAVVAFVGAVRGVERGVERERTVTHLYYEAYAPMAEAKLRQVADEMRARFPDIEGIALIQRVGLLPAGEPTVLVAVSSPHRDQGCFEAVRFGIDRIKEIVPVWKKEIGPNGEQWIEGHYTPQAKDRQKSPTGESTP